MTAPYTMSAATNNKCPHGFALGSCPLCSGMGGGAPRDKNKPRKAGEMSYNECMAEWHKIQARQNAKKQEKLENQKNFFNEVFLSKPLINMDKVIKFQNKILKNIEALPAIIKAPARFVLKAINNTINLVFNTINNIQALFQNVVQNTLKFFNNILNNIAEKLPMVLYEIKNIILLSTQKIILTPFKTILTLFVGSNTKEDDKKDKQRKKVKRILEKIFGLYFKPKEKHDNKQDFE